MVSGWNTARRRDTCCQLGGHRRSPPKVSHETGRRWAYARKAEDPDCHQLHASGERSPFGILEGGVYARWSEAARDEEKHWMRQSLNGAGRSRGTRGGRAVFSAPVRADEVNPFRFTPGLFGSWCAQPGSTSCARQPDAGLMPEHLPIVGAGWNRFARWPRSGAALLLRVQCAWCTHR